ncbi:MAG TPA: alpha/beta hydrolase [Gemmatimonas sp.]|nr:alpha/beta hydrolase [Gemmatimonas sp.]
MAQSLPLGPYKTLDVDGHQAPWYIMPFDKAGVCTAPLTRQHLLDAVTNGDFTDVFIFSHGWNNDWETASARYDDFVASFAKLRKEHALTYDRPHRPLLIGVYWPSTALVAPWEKGPKLAAGGDRDVQVAEAMGSVDEIAALIAPGDRTRFYTLAQLDRPLAAGELDEFASLLAPIWGEFARNAAADDISPTNGTSASTNTSAQDSVRVSAQASSAALKDAWRDLAVSGSDTAGDSANRDTSNGDSDSWGFADAPAGDTGPASAGIMDILLKPRDILRGFTVLQMKDRAATVGAHGVGTLLRDILGASSTARVHMLGHSYGGVVVLSAVSYPANVPLPRKVDSVLLLQPAVNRWCFASNVAGKGYPGGYRVAFDRVKQPILTTFSKHDSALTKFFHLAVRRDRDLGQPTIAGWSDVPKGPNQYAALGGYGPEGCADGECEYLPIRTLPDRYELADSARRIFALRSDDAISGHGNISVPQTWWALYNQVRTVSA